MEHSSDRSRSNSSEPRGRLQDEADEGNPPTHNETEQRETSDRERIPDSAEPSDDDDGNGNHNAQPSAPLASQTNAGSEDSQKTRDETNSNEHQTSGRPTQKDEFDPSTQMPQFDWEALLQKHDAIMREKQDKENHVHEEFNRLLRFYDCWSRVGSQFEAERARKRLRTRVAHVQRSESELEEKQAHYHKVVKAFESALDLLRHK